MSGTYDQPSRYIIDFTHALPYLVSLGFSYIFVLFTFTVNLWVYSVLWSAFSTLNILSVESCDDERQTVLDFSQHDYDYQLPFCPSVL